MLSIFLFAVGINLVRKRRIACHCLGGEGNEILSWRTVARLIAMMVGELSVIGFMKESAGPLGLIRSFSDLLVLAISIGLVLHLCMWLLRLPDIVVIAVGLFEERLRLSKLRSNTP
jgi:hypothetical protein